MPTEKDFIVNIINEMIDQRLAAQIHIAIGQVVDYDPTLYLAKVFLAYEQLETPWIRIGGVASGNLFGDKNPPQINDEVIVAFYGGTVETGVIISRIYSDPTDAPPPAGDADRVMRHLSGSQISFKESGTIEVKASEKTVLTLNSDGSFAVSNPSAQVKINADNSIELSNSNTKILLNNGKISLSNNTTELLALISNLLDELTTPGNITVVIPSGVGTFSAPIFAAIQNIKVLLQTLKA